MSDRMYPAIEYRRDRYGHRKLGWYVIPEPGRQIGRRVPVPQHWHGNVRVPETAVITADGHRLRNGERYPLPHSDQPTGTSWVAAEGDTELLGFPDFESAMTAADVNDIGSGRWARARGRHANDRWWFDPTAADAPPRSKLLEGQPCEVTVTSGDYSAPRPCLRLVKRDGVCGIHAAAEDRKAETRERWAAEADERQARERRNAEARRATAETLDEIRPLLADLGHRPDTFRADDRGITAPAETIRDLVRLAALAHDLDLTGNDR